MKLFGSFLLLVLALAVPARAADDVAARLAALSPIQRDEVLWLARCVYSESDRADEQRLVAWVVRNRVETRYRGSTYREVVLEWKQFSAFNEPTARRAHLLGLELDTLLPSWRKALDVALDVYLSDGSARPFAVETRHFYSPVSMPGGREPEWAKGAEALSSEALGVDPHRFQFFESVDPQYEGTPATSAGAQVAGRSETDRDRGPLLKPMRLRLKHTVRRPQRPQVAPPTVE